MTSLGFRAGNDHIAERPRPKRPVVLPVDMGHPEPRSIISKIKKVPCFTCMLGVPRGLLPTLFFSTLAFVVPYLYLYESYTWTDTDVRTGVFVTAAISATAAVYANDCCCWYNMALLFHTAIEVKVIDVTLTFAYADGTSDEHMALAIVAAIVLIVHLLPFFLTDRIMLLSILAYAGVIVNAGVTLYLDPSLLLLSFASSMPLLMLTMILGGICEVRTSLLSLVLEAVNSCKFITCSRFEL
jgi:hypothetical protein